MERLAVRLLLLGYCLDATALALLKRLHSCDDVNTCITLLSIKHSDRVVVAVLKKCNETFERACVSDQLAHVGGGAGARLDEKL